MADKRVSVRIVSEGGRQVRAELEGVGATGEAAFDGMARAQQRAGAVSGQFRGRRKCCALRRSAFAPRQLAKRRMECLEPSANLRKVANPSCALAAYSPPSPPRWPAGLPSGAADEDLWTRHRPAPLRHRRRTPAPGRTVPSLWRKGSGCSTSHRQGQRACPDACTGQGVGQGKGPGRQVVRTKRDGLPRASRTRLRGI